jgi:hypothetical protein
MKNSKSIYNLSLGHVGGKYAAYMLYPNYKQRLRTKIIGYFQYKFNHHKNQIIDINLNELIK